MKHALLALIAAASFACATTPAPPAPPCNPNHALLNAVLWVQSSAEYRAAALATYAAARQSLDLALADPSWVGAVEETSNDPSQPPAIVLDLDETAIDNSVFEAREVRGGPPYSEEVWTHWVHEAAATSVPGAAEFLAYATSRGVTPFYVTNRDAATEEGTLRNLEALGFPLTGGAANLLVRGERPEWGSDKSTRRAYVAASHRLLLLLGDDLNDFAPARDKSLAERAQIVESRKEWWGTRWFMLPNPMYGSWERTVTGGSGTPCEQMTKKLEALQP